jgi:hypothetical protein
MLEQLIAVLAQPNEYVCRWHDGELFVERAPSADAPQRNSTQRKIGDAVEPGAHAQA